MVKRLFDFLRCVDCSSYDLRLGIEKADKDNVITGIVVCNICKKTYEIREGILIALPKSIPALERLEMESSDLYSNIENEQYEKMWLRRIMYNYQFSYIEDIKDKDSILEIGSGNGYFLQKHNKDFGLLVGVDISFVALSNAAKRGVMNLVQAEGGNLPFKENTFSNVFTIATLHHIPQAAKVLSEMLRVKKAKGSLFIQDKNQNNFFLTFASKILRFCSGKIGEATLIKKPIRHSQIIDLFTKTRRNKITFFYHDTIAWPSHFILELLKIYDVNIINKIFSTDRFLSRIPLLANIFSWRFSMVIREG